MVIDVSDLNPDKFEDLCNTLLRREKGVKSIDGSGGDKGIDGFKGDIDGEVTIYQHKSYTGRLNDKSNRKPDIIDSYETAKEHHPGLQRWVLLIPIEFTPGEEEWFEKEIKHEDNDIEVDYWNRIEIEERLTKYNDLVRRFFPNSTLALTQKQQELVDYLSGTPIDRAWKVGQHLDKIQEENPNLGLEYTFSSEDDTAEVKLDPDVPVRLNTQLKIEQEKLEKIQQGEKVRFGADEISDVEINIGDLFGDRFEPSELVMKPWHEDWERDVQIEIPRGGFRKEMTIQVENIFDNTITLKAQNSVFSCTLKYGLEEDEVDWNIDTEFNNQPVYKISEFFNFINQLEENKVVLLRELEEGNPVFSGEINSAESFSDLGEFQSLIEDLQVIESHTGCSFHWTNDFEENFETDVKIAKDLLTDGASQWPYTLSASAIQVDKDVIEEVHNRDDESQSIVVEQPEFGVTILDQEVELGDARIKYPDAELNTEEILEWSDNSDPIPIELRPSNQAEITLQNQS